MKIKKILFPFLLLIFFIFGAVLVNNKITPSYQLKKANKLFSENKYNEALIIYNKIDNKDIPTLVKKEKSELNLKQFEDALITTNLIAVKAGNSIDTISKEYNLYYDRIICYTNLQQYQNVIDSYGKFANSINQQNNEFTKALNLNVENNVCLSYIKLNKFDECIEFINNALLKYNKDKDKANIASLNNNLYFCYYSKKDYDKSISICDKLIESNPNELSFHISKAMALEKKYNKQAAAKYLISIKTNSNINDPEKLDAFIKSFSE